MPKTSLIKMLSLTAIAFSMTSCAGRTEQSLASPLPTLPAFIKVEPEPFHPQEEMGSMLGISSTSPPAANADQMNLLMHGASF